MHLFIRCISIEASVSNYLAPMYLYHTLTSLSYPNKLFFHATTGSSGDAIGKNASSSPCSRRERRLCQCEQYRGNGHCGSHVRQDGVIVLSGSTCVRELLQGTLPLPSLTPPPPSHLFVRLDCSLSYLTSNSNHPHQLLTSIHPLPTHYSPPAVHYYFFVTPPPGVQYH